MALTAERYHSLDFLRGFAMFLGILLHGLLAFTVTRVPFWPTRNDETSLVSDLFVFAVHDFRMQVFFLLAGFFGALLHERYGLAGAIKHRFMRIAVPFGLALLIVQPTVQALWLVGDPSALSYARIESDASKPIGERLADHFLTGRYLLYLTPMHLWFLYYLILFFFLMIPLIWLGRHLEATGIGERAMRCFRGLLKCPGKALILAAITAPVLWPARIWGMTDTPEGWRLQYQIVGYYFLFFLIGWLLWRHRDLLPAFTRRWQGSLLAGNALVLPALIYLVFASVDGFEGRAPLPGEGLHVATCYIAALYTWLMIGGLIGAFQHFFSTQRPWVRYLADASYWCYLWHLTPIVALQLLLQDAPLPGLLKFAIVIGFTMVILLVTYEWCVRYTFIGAILNGRKNRKPRDVSVSRSFDNAEHSHHSASAKRN